MSLPIHVQSQLYHCKSRRLALVAAPVCSVGMVSRLCDISRKTLSHERHQAEPGRLASWDGPPRGHGSATPQRRREAVLQAQAHAPGGGQQRRAPSLAHPGMALSPKTVQRLLRPQALPGPAVPGPPGPWSACAALAPHALWARDSGALATRQPDGWARSLLPILDDPARTGIARG
jgi:hypothetical protein